ncbi:MAG: hypothetical protein QXH07_02350 [Thermoplasmata archaeon]
MSDQKDLKVLYTNVPSPNTGLSVLYGSKKIAEIIVSGENELINKKIAETIYFALNISAF